MNRCYLDTLVTDLFSLICSYLTISTKMSNFPILNKSIENMFNPESHCRHDTLLINQSAFDQYTESLIKLINVVSHVELCLCSNQTKNQTNNQLSARSLMLNSLVEAMTCGNLTTLHVIQTIDGHTKHKHLKKLIALVKKSKPVKLLELDIQMKFRQSKNTTRPCVDLTCLLDLSCFLGLRTVNMNLCFANHSDDVVVGMLAAMPSTLTFLKIEHVWNDDSLTDVLELFQSDWLPQIEHFDVSTPLPAGPQLTDIQRPFKWLALKFDPSTSLYDPLSLESSPDTKLSHLFSQLEHLTMELDYTNWAFNDIPFALFPGMELSADGIELTSMPNLKSFTLQNGETGRVCGGETDNMTDDSFKELGKMKQLVSLELDTYYQDHEIDGTIAPWITPSCWPVLETLTLTDMTIITHAALQVFITAAPALIERPVIPPYRQVGATKRMRT